MQVLVRSKSGNGVRLPKCLAARPRDCQALRFYCAISSQNCLLTNISHIRFCHQSTTNQISFCWLLDKILVKIKSLMWQFEMASAPKQSLHYPPEKASKLIEFPFVFVVSLPAHSASRLVKGPFLNTAGEGAPPEGSRRPHEAILTPPPFETQTWPSHWKGW